jgi:hypothetical protein
MRRLLLTCKSELGLLSESNNILGFKKTQSRENVTTKAQLAKPKSRIGNHLFGRGSDKVTYC